MVTDYADEQAVLLYPGEWVAVSGGQVIAHGPDFFEVAREACMKADDVSIDRAPDPEAPLWQPVDRPRA